MIVSLPFICPYGICSEISFVPYGLEGKSIWISADMSIQMSALNMCLVCAYSHRQYFSQID